MDQPPIPDKLERVELRDAVAERLREAILSGEFAAGQRLVETDLAARYGTSRGPVRDALAELEQSGLVFTINRRGSFVVTFTAADLHELYSVRGALESLAVHSAIERATTDDIADLGQSLARLDQAYETRDPRTIGEADMQFHRLIVQLASNRRLLDAWDRLADQTVLLMRELSHVRPEIQGPGGDHRKILDSFEQRDPTAGQQAILNHLEAAEQALSTRFATNSAVHPNEVGAGPHDPNPSNITRRTSP